MRTEYAMGQDGSAFIIGPTFYHRADAEAHLTQNADFLPGAYLIEREVGEWHRSAVAAAGQEDTP